MVGKRNLSYHSQSEQAPKTGGHAQQNGNGGADLESGPAPANGGNGPPKLFKFRDIANTALEDHRREELKQQLLFGLKQVDLERFRKSEQDVCSVAVLSSYLLNAD